LHSRSIASTLDMVVDTISNLETEVNQYHSSQLIKLYFFYILLTA
jgi:hypothetical protein